MKGDVCLPCRLKRGSGPAAAPFDAKCAPPILYFFAFLDQETTWTHKSRKFCRPAHLPSTCRKFGSAICFASQHLLTRPFFSPATRSWFRASCLSRLCTCSCWVSSVWCIGLSAFTNCT